MTDLQAKIEGIYGKAKVHMSNGEDLLLEPGNLLYLSAYFCRLFDANAICIINFAHLVSLFV